MSLFQLRICEARFPPNTSADTTYDSTLNAEARTRIQPSPVLPDPGGIYKHTAQCHSFTNVSVLEKSYFS